mgnify:CR=1 FL=1
MNVIALTYSDICHKRNFYKNKKKCVTLQFTRICAWLELMGFNFNFFGDTEHRVFNYRPRYYDPEKEERKRIFGEHGEDDGSDASGDAYTPGKYISGSFREGNYQKLRGSRSNKAQKIIGMVGLVLFFVILYYVAQFYGMILK